jgi:hypothetical protein
MMMMMMMMVVVVVVVVLPEIRFHGTFCWVLLAASL